MNNLLTEREFEVYSEMVQGATNKEIARKLHISHSTVKAHISNILLKTKAKNRQAAIIIGILKYHFQLSYINIKNLERLEYY